MVEIEFSYIYDFEHDEQTWAAFMDEFAARQGVKVHLRQMTWDMAWAELFSYTSHRKGPHVSHIGNTWVGSLARLNVLRPFASGEIASMGGAWDFVAANWESGILLGDKHIWAIPWTTWIYVICYRKDLLERAGVDPSNAFGTVKTTKETIHQLVNSTLKIPWINPRFYVTPSHDLLHATSRDLMHIAASWVWASQGEFVDREGTKILFNSPQALDGLNEWLETYRAVPEKHKRLSQRQSLELFREGQAAAVITNIYRANLLVNEQDNPLVRDHLGIASPTEVPWTGGGSLIIWDHVRANLQQEHAAVELVKFLTSKENNLRYHNTVGSMPARMDALKQVYPDGNPAHEAVLLAATKGRGYHNVPIWRRIESQLGDAIGVTVNEAADNLASDPMDLLHQHLDALVERLNNTIAA